MKPSKVTAHNGHPEDVWFWGCDGCNPLDTDMGGQRITPMKPSARTSKKQSVEDQARLDREFARAAMEADLNKHFPLIEDWLDDGYQVTCDATGCDFSTDIGHYGAIMSQWNGHIADVLSISGDHT